MGLFQATSVSVDSLGLVGVISMGRSSSFPLWNVAPALKGSVQKKLQASR